MIQLKKTTIEDLQFLFEFQTDYNANNMAAFTSENPNDKEAYMEKWKINLANPQINLQTILFNKKIVGSIAHFEMMGDTNVTYWIDTKYWGKGIATESLNTFVNNIDKRPLFARVAFDNFGSQRVLEKCGFLSIKTEKGFANARKMEIEEYIYKLE